MNIFQFLNQQTFVDRHKRSQKRKNLILRVLAANIKRKLEFPEILGFFNIFPVDEINIISINWNLLGGDLHTFGDV